MTGVLLRQKKNIGKNKSVRSLTFKKQSNVFLEKCRRLVSLARKYDVLLFADDVYNLLTYTDDGVPPPRLLAYDNK